MSPEPLSRIAENLRSVRGRIADAVGRSGRSESEIRLVAVTKYARLEWVSELLRLGVRLLGESRPQQFAERVGEIEVPRLDVSRSDASQSDVSNADSPRFDSQQSNGPIEWHFIGHLQRNKVRLVLPHASLTHSVDSPRLLERVDEIAAESGIAPTVLLQVNVSGESTKGGFSPEALERDWSRLIAAKPAKIAGLMTMAPASDDPEDARSFFAALRELRDRLVLQSPPEVTLSELSMGMSGDFDVAIEEGATLIRVGSALFEGMSEG